MSPSVLKYIVIDRPIYKSSSTPDESIVGGPTLCLAIVCNTSNEDTSSLPITPELIRRFSPHSFGDSPTRTIENFVLP